MAQNRRTGATLAQFSSACQQLEFKPKAGAEVVQWEPQKGSGQTHRRGQIDPATPARDSRSAAALEEAPFRHWPTRSNVPGIAGPSRPGSNPYPFWFWRKTSGRPGGGNRYHMKAGRDSGNRKVVLKMACSAWNSKVSYPDRAAGENASRDRSVFRHRRGAERCAPVPRQNALPD
jgi:hypothetical protein